MQPTRTFIRSPQVCRIARAPTAARTMSLFSAPPFYPRFPMATMPSIGNELAPFFRMVDDLTSSSRIFDHFSQPAPVRSFQPRFDVREVGETYELRGELPGVESKDLEVEFTDAQTLVIRGRTESETTSGTPHTPSQAIAAAESTPSQAMAAAESTTINAAVDNSDAVSTHSSTSYQKPFVEDEEGVVEASATSTPGQATPAESTVSETQPQAIQTAAQPAQQTQTQENTPRYWVSERSTGSFQRVFNFPARVDQAGVTASLKNGILNIVVPKAAAPRSRRITVE